MSSGPTFEPETALKCGHLRHDSPLTWLADAMAGGGHAGNPGRGPSAVCMGLTKGTVLCTECMCYAGTTDPDMHEQGR